MIRSGAEEEDLIFGFAANSLSRDNRLIYVARVTKTLPDGRYYKDPRYAKRGDCIYTFRAGRFVRRRTRGITLARRIWRTISAFILFMKGRMCCSVTIFGTSAEQAPMITGAAFRS